MESCRKPWGWGWWVLALLVLAGGVLLAHQRIQQRREAEAAARRYERFFSELGSIGCYTTQDEQASDHAAVAIHLLGDLATDAWLARLEGSPTTAHMEDFPRLKRAYLSGSQITDTGMSYIGPWTGLQVLDLSNTRITDGGLTHVERLTDLRVLLLDRTGVTDGGLHRLAPLTRLDFLNLSHTAVTDAGLLRLQELTGLSKLWLVETRVTAAGVARLRKALPETAIRWPD
jgi:hypothetical protein